MTDIARAAAAQTQVLALELGLTDSAQKEIIQKHLVAMLAMERRDKWEPIETAPKNWTDVLLYDPGYRSDHISGNVFHGYFEAEMEIWCDASAEPVSPTHWQHLPSPPEGGEQP